MRSQPSSGSKKKTIPGARLVHEVKEYKKPALLSPVFTICCVFLEILIPYLTASIIDKGIAMGDMGHVVRIGLVMIVFTLLACYCGVMAGRLSAKASTGFAYNLRDAMYANIQTFSFKNIDKYTSRIPSR